MVPSDFWWDVLSNVLAGFVATGVLLGLKRTRVFAAATPRIERSALIVASSLGFAGGFWVGYNGRGLVAWLLIWAVAVGAGLSITVIGRFLQVRKGH